MKKIFWRNKKFLLLFLFLALFIFIPKEGGAVSYKAFEMCKWANLDHGYYVCYTPASEGHVGYCLARDVSSGEKTAEQAKSELVSLLNDQTPTRIRCCCNPLPTQNPPTDFAAYENYSGVVPPPFANPNEPGDSVCTISSTRSCYSDEIEYLMNYCFPEGTSQEIIDKEIADGNRCCCQEKYFEDNVGPDATWIKEGGEYDESDEDDVDEGCFRYCKGKGTLWLPTNWGPFLGCIVSCGLAKFIILQILIVPAILVFVTTIIAVVFMLIFGNIFKALIVVKILDVVMVKEMWALVRDFANIFYILFFVLIGLATILRIESYKFQKTLPLLLIMALLTNFSLVLVDLVVNIGNILTQIFAEGVAGGVVGWNGVVGLGFDFFKEVAKFFVGAGGELSDVFIHGMGLSTYGYVLFIFLLCVIAVFFVIIFVFYLRIIMLWILAILSPLAFVSYVFESTRTEIWTKWLKNLFQWSIIGVPILFFMYLGFQVLEHPPSEIRISLEKQSIEEQSDANEANEDIRAEMRDVLTINEEDVASPISFFDKFFQQTTAPSFALIIIVAGVIISLTLIPEGARTAVTMGSTAGSFLAGSAISSLRNIPAIGRAEMAVREQLETSGFGRFIGVKAGGVRDEESKNIKKHQEALKNIKSENHEKYVRSHVGKEREHAAAAVLFNKTEAGKSVSERERDVYLPWAQRVESFDVDKFNEYDPTFENMHDSKGVQLTDRQKSDMILQISAGALATQLSDGSYNRARSTNPAILRSILRVITQSNQNFTKWFASSSRVQKEVILNYVQDNSSNLGGFNQQILDRLVSETGGYFASP